MLVEDANRCEEEGGVLCTLRPERLVRFRTAVPLGELAIQRLHVQDRSCGQFSTSNVKNRKTKHSVVVSRMGI